MSKIKLNFSADELQRPIHLSDLPYPKPCKTNVFVGKKMDEITKIHNRYSILPSIDSLDKLAANFVIEVESEECTMIHVMNSQSICIESYLSTDTD